MCFGETRKVSRESTISVGGARYSVPHRLIDERVWVRVDGERLIVIHVHPDRGPTEAAQASVDDAGPSRRSLMRHHPPRPAGALARRPRPRSAEEQAFLAIGPAAETWLMQAAAAGTQRLRRKIAEAVDLSKLHGPDEVNRALETCARASRFADGDLASVLAHQQRTGGELVMFPAARGRSLQRSTRSWKGFGR